MDDRARGYERAAGAGGAEARARALWERVRRGDLDPERLRLAAHAGDAGARLAVGAAGPLADPPLAVVRGLDAWGKEALVRAALAAVGRCLHVVAPGDPVHDASRAVVEALAAWLTRPDGRDAAAAEAAQAGRATFLLDTRDPRAPAWEALREATLLLEARTRTSPARGAAAKAADALALEGRVDDPEGEVALAVREALAAWALGDLDPLARFGPPADPALWDAPPAPPPLPRRLERTWQGDFVLDRLDGQRWLVLEQEGKRYRVTPFSPRAGERARAFACSLAARVVAWARSAPDGERVEVRRFADGVFQEWSLLAAGEVVDVAVSPPGERVAFTTSDGEADAVWHLDLRLASVEPTRVEVEHDVVRSLHFATHCALGFVTDRAAWEACPPEERKEALLERLGVRLHMLY